MESDRETKTLFLFVALVGAITCGVNYVIADSPDQSFISWSVGLFVVAVLFWIWIRRDDVAANRTDALKSAEEAARKAEELAEKASIAAKQELDKATEKVKDVAKKVEEKVKEQPKPVVEEPKPVPVAETPKAETVTNDMAEDLTKVEGIGPKYMEALYAAGITKYAQIAASSQADLEKLIKDAGMRRPASVETWAEQAAYAAKGDWDGLAKFQATLDGGRRK